MKKKYIIFQNKVEHLYVHISEKETGPIIYWSLLLDSPHGMVVHNFLWDIIDDLKS